VQRPKLRGTTEKFASRLFGTGITRTNALESLVIASFVRGLSVRDVENALADALGPEAALSKSTVSTICQAIRSEYAAWCDRDLSGVVLDYLFLDASHFKMHTNAGSRCWRPGASPTRANQCSSGSRRPPRRAPTRGRTSWRAWSSAG
jgi:transposase-like protein